MSQSAAFYPISSNNFSAIERNPGHLEILRNIKNYVTFQGTHEGLRFVLTKGLSRQEADLVNEIFYPATYIGEVSQTVVPNPEEVHEFTDVTDDENNDDFEREPVPYHTPEKVKQVTALLNRISSEQLLTQFDHEELNRENIYPCCWNKNASEHQPYNERHILWDYQHLKELFTNASLTNSYLLCFVG
jgi:hypothetical protein